MTEPIPLDELFFHLVRDGFPLAVRDLREALSALEAGFGVGSRSELMRLCQNLWARSEEETRRIEYFFRNELPLPTAREIAAITGQPDVPPDEVVEPRREPEPQPDTSTDRREAGAVEILGPDRAGGIGLPRAVVSPARGESFILTPKPLVSFRSLVIAWRRYRRALRSEPTAEVDFERTVSAKAQRGFLSEPIMVSSRRNQARIVVLVDANAAMATWADSTVTLVDSLREGRLGDFGVFYFDAVPDRLFERSGLTGPVSVAEQSARFRDAPALMVSDGGSARGGIDHVRIRATRRCLEELAQWWRPLAWLNPMPPRRWRGTSAAAIARVPGLTMLPLTAEGVIQAIDLLRGQRQS